jgi:Fur family zinc uptake transcriptional regulator
MAASDPASPEPHSHPHPHALVEACAHGEAHAARAPEALAAAEKHCTERGLRLTPIRKQVLQTLYATHHPMSAYDVIDGLTAAGVKKLAPVTVYRAMDFLITEGFVHRLASRNAFIACPFHHARGDLVVFMICETCSGVDEVTSEPLTRALAALTEDHHFIPHARVIELQGLCAHCRLEEKLPA